METVNKIASAASQAIWGDQSATESNTTENETGGQEPLSGETGDVKSGEPYDKGNDGVPKPTSSDTAVGGSQGAKSLIDPAPSSSTSDHNASSSTTGTNPTSSGTVLGAPVGTSGSTAENTSTPTASTTDTPSAGAGILGTPGNIKSTNTTTTGDLDSSRQTMTEHQGAGQPNLAPNEFETQRIRETKQEAEDAASRPVEDRTKASGAGTGMGTGESYDNKKSTGVAADGGNFNAANPGAGKEARRLLDEQKESEKHASTSSDSSKDDDKDTPGKLSLKDKIKAKLHKH